MTPVATKIALVAALLLTGAVVVEFRRRTTAADIDPQITGYALSVLAVLFFVRVAGQLAVVVRAPGWLPPMRDWNLAPYRIVLLTQIVFLALMVWICVDLIRDAGAFATPSPGFGKAAVWFSIVYASAIVVRYALRMVRRPEQRWFGGTIPIVFHLVLASFVYVWGSFNASY